MIRELDIVQLARDLPSLGLRRGDTATVVLVHKHGAAYEVELSARFGETVAVITLTADQIMPGPARAGR